MLKEKKTTTNSQRVTTHHLLIKTPWLSLFFGSWLFSSRCVFPLSVQWLTYCWNLGTFGHDDHNCYLLRLLQNDSVNTCASVLAQIDSDLVTVEESFRAPHFSIVHLFSLSLNLCGTWTHHSWSDLFCFTLFLLPSSARCRSAVEAETDLKQTPKKTHHEKAAKSYNSAEFSDGHRWNISRRQCWWVPKRSRCSLNRHTHAD